MYIGWGVPHVRRVGVPYVHIVWGGTICTYDSVPPTICTLLDINREPSRSTLRRGVHLHPSGSAGWTLSGEDLGKFGLEKAILGYLGPF